jgi:hypothetical protein
MNILFETESESTHLTHKQRTALQSLLFRLPKTEMMAIGKTCLAMSLLSKQVHQSRVTQAFSKYLYCDTPPLHGQQQQHRTGIVLKTNTTTHSPNVFYPHQIKAAIDVVKTEVELEWEDKHVTKFLFWEMGSGKTLAGVSIMSIVHAFTPPDVKYTALIVVPLAVMTVWKETITSWTTVKESEILCTQKEHDITDKSLSTSKIVIVTPDTVVSAFKSYMWKNPRHTRLLSTTTGTTRYVAGYERLCEPTPKYAKRGVTGPPPVHPLFLLSPTVLIVDECQLFTNAQSIRCYAVHKIASATKYTIGCSGTPFQNSPNEASGLCRTLAVKDTNLWLKASWMKTGCRTAIRYNTVKYMHSKYVSRVNAEVLDLPPKSTVRVDFEPFVGDGKDGSIIVDDVKTTNTKAKTSTTTTTTTTNSYSSCKSMNVLCLRTFSSAVKEARSVSLYNRNAIQKQKLMGKLIRAVSTMEQGYADRTLCIRGASMYGKQHMDDVSDESLSLSSPSQQNILLHAIVRDRQKAGRRKIVVFSTQTQMVSIAAKYLRHAGGCGLIMEYTGKSTLTTRNAMVSAFLSDEAPKAVMFITKAGGVGVTLCPGCETFIIFGSYPWSNEEVRQAAARVHRIGQTQPVEEILLVPSRSTTKAKIDQIYKDKDERLVKLLRDGDKSGFDSTGEGVWRIYAGVGRSITGLDNQGNHIHTDPHPNVDPHAQLRADYKAAVRLAERRNQPIPPCPQELLPPASKRVSEIKLPRVSFPVEGFVEEQDATMYDDLYFEPPRSGNYDVDVEVVVSETSQNITATTHQAASFASAWECDTDDDDDDM